MSASGRSHALAFAILGMTAIFVATVVGWWALLPEIAPKRIVLAVLPFERDGVAPAQRWLGDGIAEDVRIALAQTPEFVVLASAASFAHRDRRARFVALADELGATHAVVGSAARDGGRLSIAARLIYLAERATLWEDEWDGAEADLFQMRDEIARAIAGKLLLVGASRASAGPPVAPEAYAAFLHGRALAQVGELDAAARQMRASLDRDANNPYAHAWLARLRLLQQDIAAARRHADAALAAAPSYPPTLTFAAWLRFHQDSDAKRWFDELYALAATQRDEDAMRWLAELYAAANRAADAKLLRDALRRLDPARANRAPALPAPALEPNAIDAIGWRPAAALFPN